MSHTLPWRKPVVSHSTVLVYSFRADRLAHPTTRARSTFRLRQLSNDWHHWLKSAAESPASTSNGIPDELLRIIDDSLFFLEHIRDITHPEFKAFKEAFGTESTGGSPAPAWIRECTTAVSGTYREFIDEVARLPRGPSLLERAVLRVRLSDSRIPHYLKSMRVEVLNDPIAYTAQVEYIDVCVFPDCQALLLIKLSAVKRETGASLSTYEIGRFMRHLRQIHFRYRTLRHPVVLYDGANKLSLAQAINPFVAAFSQSRVTSESLTAGDVKFRALNFFAVEREPGLNSTGSDALFTTARERLIFEAATGHDTTNTQEVPSQRRIREVQEAIISQWANFGALIFWDDATFFIEDRTGSVFDPPQSSSLDEYARITYPSQVENQYLWLFMISIYQYLRSRSFIQQLSILGGSLHRGVAAASNIADDFLRFRNLYWSRDATLSQIGIAYNRAMLEMYDIEGQIRAIGDQLTSVHNHFQLVRTQVSEENERATRNLLTVLSIVGIPVGILATILAGRIESSSVVQELTPMASTVLLALSAVLLSSVCVVIMLVSKRRTADRIKRGSFE